MIVEAVDGTLRTIREILHKRAHLSSRSQALDELAKLLFAHVCRLRSARPGLSRDTVSSNGAGLSVALKRVVDKALQANLPSSLSHRVDVKDFELKLRPHEDELAGELLDCFERLQRQTSSFNFSGFDILNEVFGKFLADSFIDEKELGQYLTPTEVVRFMCGLAIAGLSEDERRMLSRPEECHRFGLILDPSCGVGSFLAEITNQLRSGLKIGEHAKDSWLDALLSKVAVGIDKSERMVRLALTNLAMFGFPMARLYLANSLSRNGPDGALTESLVGKARLILTNPPFGASFEGNDLVKYRIARDWSRRLPARIDSEVLFFERYLDWLAPGGQLLAVVPDSILTNKGIFEDLRRGISKEIELLGVISLPPVTFAVAGTSTKTSVVHLRRKAGGATATEAAFAICEDIGFTVSTKSNHRIKVVESEGDLPQILAEITSHSSGECVRWIADPTTRERWDAQHHASLTAEIELRLNGDREHDVYVSNVADLIDERVDPRRWGAKHFNYIEISDIDTQSSVVYSNSIDVTSTPSRARKLVKSGDVFSFHRSPGAWRSWSCSGVSGRVHLHDRPRRFAAKVGSSCLARLPSKESVRYSAVDAKQCGHRVSRYQRGVPVGSAFADRMGRHCCIRRSSRQHRGSRASATGDEAFLHQSAGNGEPAMAATNTYSSVHTSFNEANQVPSPTAHKGFWFTCSGCFAARGRPYGLTSLGTERANAKLRIFPSRKNRLTAKKSCALNLQLLVE